MFQLAQSIESWKKQFYYRKGISPWDIYELSQHLEEEIALHQAKGLSDEKAFQLATEHLGKPELIENEYSKLDRSKKNGISLAVVAKLFWNMLREYKYLILTFFGILSSIFLLQQWIYYHFILTPMVEYLRVLLLLIMFGIVGIFSMLILSLTQFRKKPSLHDAKKKFIALFLFVIVDYLLTLMSLVLSYLIILPGLWFYSRFFLTPWAILDRSPCIVSALRSSYWLTSTQPWFCLFLSFINLLLMILWLVIMHHPFQLFYQAFYLVFKAILIAIIYHYFTSVFPLERE